MSIHPLDSLGADAKLEIHFVVKKIAKPPTKLGLRKERRDDHKNLRVLALFQRCFYDPLDAWA